MCGLQVIIPSICPFVKHKVRFRARVGIRVRDPLYVQCNQLIAQIARSCLINTLALTVRDQHLVVPLPPTKSITAMSFADWDERLLELLCAVLLCMTVVHNDIHMWAAFVVVFVCLVLGFIFTFLGHCLCFFVLCTYFQYFIFPCYFVCVWFCSREIS